MNPDHADAFPLETFSNLFSMRVFTKKMAETRQAFDPAACTQKLLFTPFGYNNTRCINLWYCHR